MLHARLDQNGLLELEDLMLVLFDDFQSRIDD